MKKCPKCHKLNNSNAKFCKFCGTNLQNVKSLPKGESGSHPKKKVVNHSVLDKNGNIHKYTTEKTFKNKKHNRKRYQNNTASYTDEMKNDKLTREESNHTPKPDYSQSWNNANQAMNKVSNYSGNYFVWLKNCLMHPSKHHHGNPYFGFFTFIIQGILLILTLIVGNHSETISNSLEDINGKLPLQAYYENITNQSSIGVIILGTIFAFLSFILVGYLIKLISFHKANLFKASNQLASLTSINIFVFLLMLVSAIIAKDSFVEMFIYISAVVNVTGLTKMAVNKHAKLDTSYIAIGTIIVWFLIKGLIMTMLDLLL